MSIKIKKESIEIDGVLFGIEAPAFIGGRTPKGYENDIAVIRYDDDRRINWVIADLHWDEKEPCYELVSVGMRLAEDGTTELLKWLFKIAEKYEKIIMEM